jgi:hypothetical protein
MAYPGTLSDIGYKDGTALDAASRLRVSNTHVLHRTHFGVTVSGGSTNPNPNFWVSNIANGATITDSQPGSVSLNAVNTSTSEAERQTRQMFLYVPGQAMTVYMTFLLNEDTDTGYRRVVGWTEAGGTDSGIYLQSSNSNAISWVLNSANFGSSSVEQASWNKDPLDGTGPSGVTIDWAKNQTLWIRLSGTGKGRVQVGFTIDGIDICVHEYSSSLVGGGLLLTRDFGAPLSYHVFNQAGAGASATTALQQVSSLVILEGDEEKGIIGSFTNGATLITAPIGQPVGLIGVRLRNVLGRAFPVSVEVLNTGTDPVVCFLYFNPTPAVGGPLTWGDPAGFTAGWVNMEVATNAAAVTFNASSRNIATFYVLEGASRTVAIPESLLGLGVDIAGGQKDHWVLAARTLSGQASPLGACFTWREIW